MCLVYFENLYMYVIQINTSRLFMYNKIFSDIFLLGKKKPYPPPPVSYANNVQKTKNRQNKNSWYSDSSRF